jgi:hypothetical protein
MNLSKTPVKINSDYQKILMTIPAFNNVLCTEYSSCMVTHSPAHTGFTHKGCIILRFLKRLRPTSYPGSLFGEAKSLVEAGHVSYKFWRIFN